MFDWSTDPSGPLPLIPVPKTPPFKNLPFSVGEFLCLVKMPKKGNRVPIACLFSGWGKNLEESRFQRGKKAEDIGK